MTDDRRKAERRHAKPPAFQFYAKDWLVDTAHLSLEEQGAYIRLLAHQWISGALPRTLDDKARLLRVRPPTFKRLWARLAEHFPRGKNPRLERVREELEAYRERQAQAGQRGADRRWHGKPIPTLSPRQSPQDGKPIATPLAGRWPDDSSASASALKDKSSNPDDEPIYDEHGRPSPVLTQLAGEVFPGRSRGKR